MNADEKKAVLAALKSGKYKQGRNRLRTGNCFCVQGVIADVVLVKKRKVAQWVPPGEHSIGVGHALVTEVRVDGRETCHTTLLYETSVLLGFVNRSARSLLEDLFAWNDGTGKTETPMTFPEIAARLEADPRWQAL